MHPEFSENIKMSCHHRFLKVLTCGNQLQVFSSANRLYKSSDFATNLSLCLSLVRVCCWPGEYTSAHSSTEVLYTDEQSEGCESHTLSAC